MKKILIVIISLLAIVVILQYVKNERLYDDIQIKNVELSSLKDSVTSFVSDNGKLVAKINSVQVEKDNLKDALNVAGFDIKELRSENIRLRKINAALKLEVQSTGSVITQVVDTFFIDVSSGVPDTVSYTKINNWTNDYLSIFNGTIIKRELNFDYSYKTGIDLILENRKKQSIVTVTLTDPNAKVTTANSITIDKHTPWYKTWWFWGITGTTVGVLIAK